MVKEYETFFVRYAGKCVIGIFALEIHDQFCKLVSRSKKGDRVRESLPANDGREVTMGFAMSNREFRARVDIKRASETLHRRNYLEHKD